MTRRSTDQHNLSPVDDAADNTPKDLPENLQDIPSSCDSEIDQELQEPQQPETPKTKNSKKGIFCPDRTKIGHNIYYDVDRMKSVISYRLPEELEICAEQYEDDDPAFVTHLRRAHKYHSHKHCAGMDVWNISVKGRDDKTDRYNRLYFTKRGSIPTPEEIRDAGIIGFVRLVLTYFDPYKPTKNGGLGGWAVISSKPIEIMSPVVLVQSAHTRPE